MLRLVPFELSHIDQLQTTVLTSDLLIEKYGHMYENCASGTLIDDNDVPVISFGLYILWPGVAEVWTAPRPTIKQHGIEVSRIVRRVLKDSIVGNNLWRVQARCVHEDTTAFYWLNFFGFKYEGTLKKYGPDGSDYDLLAIVI